jgi:pimeloyl-ACP methyl ester carboxylesterase
VSGREKAVRFGTGGTLVGILTDPAPGSDAAGKPAVVLLNSGILHRVGSCRLHVVLARTLSRAGFASLRFDYSGVGDSDQRKDSLSFEESAVLETREAMDYLAKVKGARQFLLMGLCSGADMGHETAVVDDRVVGLMMIDAWAYRDLGWYIRRYGPKLLSLKVWANAIKIRWQMLRGAYQNKWKRPTNSEVVEYEMPKYVRVFPPKEKVGRDLMAFVNRGIDLYFIWTGGIRDFNHRNQYRRVFSRVPFGDLLRVEHVPTADHILTNLEHQAFVVTTTEQWALKVAAKRRTEAPTSAPPPSPPRAGRVASRVA